MALATEFKPHALVSDARLPGMDGAELAEWFTQNMPMCKVVLDFGILVWPSCGS
jgi:CheY-like chemotaxis protein